MATANPVLNQDYFLPTERSYDTAHRMTLSGTVLKTAMLLVLVVAAGAVAWTQSQAHTGSVYAFLVGGSIVGLIAALATCWFPKIAAWSSPVYAIAEGCFLGAISLIFEVRYPGIAVQAAALSTGVLAAMLGLYGSGMVRATARFRTGVFAATAGIALVYLGTMIAGFFGVSVPYIHSNGLIGIGFSVFVVVIAALNLILDFDTIETGVRARAPKYMEWYAAFGLLVTLVWMYLEILRLLAKIRGRD